MQPLLSLLLAAIATGQASASDLRQLSIDDLIARLSPVGCEREGDPEHLVLRPAEEELHRRLADGVRMSDEQWQRALLGAEVIRYRKRWPADPPLGVGVYPPRWIDPIHVRVVPREPSSAPIDAGIVTPFVRIQGDDCGMSVPQAVPFGYGELGLLGLGKHRIVLEVTLDDGTSPSHSKKGTPGLLIWKGTVEIEVEIVPSLKEVLPSNASSELGDLVRTSLFQVASAPSPDDALASDVTLYLELEGAASAALGKTAVSFEVELSRGPGSTKVIKNGLLVQRYGYRPCPAPTDQWISGPISFGSLAGTYGQDGIHDLELRIHGVSDGALRQWDARDWWNGSISIPLSQVPSRPLDRRR